MARPMMRDLDDPANRGDAFIADLRARRRPRLYVISGPSGVGKDTLIEKLRDRLPDVHFAVTATTRERRPGEIDGVHYYFYDPEAFAVRLAEGDFLESAMVYQYAYGVPRSPVRHALARGQDVIVKVDVQGADTIRLLAPNATFIFVAPESMPVLLQRLRSRKMDDPEALMRRFSEASRELLRARDFDYVIFNESDMMMSAANQIHAIIESERLRTDQPEITI